MPLRAAGTHHSPCMLRPPHRLGTIIYTYAQAIECIRSIAATNGASEKLPESFTLVLTHEVVEPTKDYGSISMEPQPMHGDFMENVSISTKESNDEVHSDATGCPEQRRERSSPEAQKGSSAADEAPRSMSCCDVWRCTTCLWVMSE